MCTRAPAAAIRFAGRPLLIGSFSAASNVTGILTDTGAVAALLHAHGALSFWDYAAAGPYVPIRVAASRPGAGDHKDAVFLSPHKFPGGPQTPGVLVVRRDRVRNPVPTVPGGGTVAFVDPIGHRDLDDPVAGRKAAPPRSWSRSAPGWCSPSSRRSAPARSPPARTTCGSTS
jgi:selenocysteine lyase/cysteine desulfurase